jgi:hypothetical protein
LTVGTYLLQSVWMHSSMMGSGFMPTLPR